MAPSRPPTLPIIDLSTYTTSTPPQQQLIAHDLAHACSSLGFVYIAGHGLAPEQIEAAFAWSKKFFDLPVQDKMKAPHPDGPSVHRGYSHPGLEKVSQEIGPDDELGSRARALRQVADYKVRKAVPFAILLLLLLLFLTPEPQPQPKLTPSPATQQESYELGAAQNTEQPNVWPPAPLLPGFRPFLTDFYWAFHHTARLVLSVLARGIGLSDGETEALLRLHSGLNNQLRLLHYPPVRAADVRAGKVARMPAHSDWSSITMLLQDEAGGLEVEDPQRPGAFIPVTPVRGTLVLNVGDLLQRWSNDTLHSTFHRVTLPPLASADRVGANGDGDGPGDGDGEGDNRLRAARYSIPYFVAPDPDAVIECLPSCMGADRPRKYGSVVQREYGLLRAGLHYVGV